MDERVKRIKTAEKCEIFARNAENRGRPDLAREAKIRAVEIRAAEFGSSSEAENEALLAGTPTKRCFQKRMESEPGLLVPGR